MISIKAIGYNSSMATLANLQLILCIVSKVACVDRLQYLPLLRDINDDPVGAAGLFACSKRLVFALQNFSPRPAIQARLYVHFNLTILPFSVPVIDHCFLHAYIP